MKNKFKTGVSNWCITFKGGETVPIKTVKREIVDLYADGKTRIVLHIAEIHDDLKSKMIKGVEIKKIEREEQFYVLDKHMNGELEKLPTLSIYPNMQIHRVRDVETENEWAVMEIIFIGGTKIKDGKAQF